MTIAKPTQPLHQRIQDQATKLITHASCPDGLASAMIIAAALPDLPIEFHTYGTPELEDMKAEPGLIFVDFSPPRERAQEFVDAGCFVLDHHKGAKDIVDLFGANGIFADEKEEPGVSGALLAYAHIYEPLIRESPQIRGFAVIAGVRDTWQKDHELWKESCWQAAALSSLDRDELVEQGRKGSAFLFQMQVEVGRALFEARARDVAKVKVAEFKVENDDGDQVRLSIFNDSGRIVSDVAELIRSKRPDGFAPADVCCGFSYRWDPSTGPTLNFSIRGAGLDVSSFCKRYGGGGHSAAGGFNVSIRSDLAPDACKAGSQLAEPDPFETFHSLFSIWFAEQILPF